MHRHPRRGSLTNPSLSCVFVGVTLLAQGCCPPRPEGPPFSRTAYGRAITAQGIGAACARSILARASPTERRKLRQLMFIANLQMASGNERYPRKLYHRVKRELNDPVAVTPQVAHSILSGMARFIAALPRDANGLPRPLTSRQGWALVSVMLKPAQGMLPSRDECLKQILAMGDDLAVAFLLQHVNGPHYHRYNMKRAILRALNDAGRNVGVRALPLYARVIRTSWRVKISSTPFGRAVQGARAVLGPAFDHWYWEVRGKSYCADVK